MVVIKIGEIDGSQKPFKPRDSTLSVSLSLTVNITQSIVVQTMKPFQPEDARNCDR